MTPVLPCPLCSLGERFTISGPWKEAGNLHGISLPLQKFGLQGLRVGIILVA